MTEDTNLFGEPLPRLGAPLFTERWSNAKAFWIGVYVGQGLSAAAICKRLNDGVTPNMITAMTSFWGYRSPAETHTHAPVPVVLAGRYRTQADEEARRRDLSLPEIGKAVIENVARDQLWKAILDA